MSAVTFEYRASDRSGVTVKGRTTAASKVEAYRQIASEGLTPLSLRVASKRRRKGGKVRRTDIAQLTYQLSVFVEAGIPLSEGLASIGEEDPNAPVSEIVMDLATRIESGERIAEALTAHRKHFGDIYIENIRAAEYSGTLGRSFVHLSEMLERTEEANKQLKGALMYPAVVITVLMGASTFLVVGVLPKFGRMFDERGVDLPIFSRAVMGFGELVQTWWYLVLLLVASLVIVVRQSWRTRRGQLVIDALLHRVPYLNKLLVGIAISRFVRVLGVGLGAGLGLIECLELSGRASGRPMLKREVERVAMRVSAGDRLADSLKSCTYLTPFAKRMLRAGEKAGQLPKMTDIVARHYERENEHFSKNIATVIEPVLVVLIAAVVLVVALAIFLPMWNMVTLMG